MKILAIETSCDETAAAVVEVDRGNFNSLSNIISSQEKIHAEYGGIVPEVAARLHIEKILAIIDMALKRAKNKLQDIDHIAVCAGPGLISSLMVGVETAKTLAYVFKKPLVKINHIEGHLYSFKNSKFQISNSKKIPNSKFQIPNSQIKFPAVALIVSGGHTQIILVEDYLEYKLIGQTRDDAAGEAFDKVAKILGLGYPGGPVIAKKAGEVQSSKSKAQNKFKYQNLKFKIELPRPMMESGDFDMSFSGLKTAVLYLWKDLQKRFKKHDLETAKSYAAKEFQQAIIDVLVYKTLKAAKKHKAKTIILGGGVSANQELRKQMQRTVKKSMPAVKLLLPDLKMTGDNAAMIAMAAYYHIKKKDFVEPFKLKADPNWDLIAD